MKKGLKKRLLTVLTLSALTIFSGCSNKGMDEGSSVETGNLPVATIKVKGFGTIEAELYPDKAPNTVNNFIELANDGFYDGLTFHRVIEGFMNQGGCPLGNGTGDPGYSIKGEFRGNGYENNDLKHKKGVLSMARAQNPDSAGSQFFIMAEDYPSLDDQYAAFGMVTSGIDVVEAINKVQTGRNDMPVEPVVIEEVRVNTNGVKYPAPEKIK